MEILVTQFVLFILLFVRIGSMIVVAPVFGHQSVPVLWKVTIAMFIAYILMPVMSAEMGKIDTRLLPFVLIILRESFVGILLGFASGLIFAGIRYAGEIISFSIGLSMMNIFDPESGTSQSVIGEFFYIFALLVFLIINGHHFLLESIRMTYVTVPLGEFLPGKSVLDILVKMSGMIFVFAVKFSAPIMVTTFIINVAFAVVARVMPQMNIFFVGVPVNIGVGLVVLITTLPFFVFVFKKALTLFEQNVIELVKSL